MLTLAAAVALDRLLPPDEKSTLDSSTKKKGKKVFGSKIHDSLTTTRWMSTLVYVAIGAFVSAAIAVCAVFALASYHNYPGGRAVQLLLERHIRSQVCGADALVPATESPFFVSGSPDASYASMSRSSGSGSNGVLRDSMGPGDLQFSVHIDVAPAMTGVSR